MSENQGTVLYLVTSAVSTRFLRGQLGWLARHGFVVHLACADGPELEGFEHAEGVTVHRLPFVRDPNPWRDLRALVATVRLLRRVRPSVVHASTPKAGFLGTVAARLCRVPVRVFLIRGLRFEQDRGVRRWALRSLDRIAARSATHVLANSASLLSVATAEGVVAPGTGTVLGHGSSNGVDMRRFDQLPTSQAARRAAGIPEESPVIGFVGRLTNDKGVPDLLDVFDTVVQRWADARLLVVGGFEPGDAVDDGLRRRMEHDPNVALTGWLDDPVGFYPAMDVLVFPSYREGLPNVVLEAQAAGVPVAAYSATGTRDALVGGIGGELVAVGDRGALGRTVVSLLEDDPRRRQLGEQGRAWVAATFRPERIWTELAEQYLAWQRKPFDPVRRPEGTTGVE